MRIAKSSGLEPQVIECIKHYRRRAFALRAGAACVLMAAVIAALAVYVVKLAGLAGEGATHPAGAGPWVALGVVAAALALAVMLIDPGIIPVVSPKSFDSFKDFGNALEGVSIAAGIEPPRLLATDLPTANSISIRYSGRPAVGVTTDALRAGLSPRHAEAMMAHEVSHILLGDVVLDTSTRRWRLVGLSLVAAIVLPFVFLSLAYGFGPWIYIGLVGWTVFTVVLINVAGRQVFRQNDLLADSVAAKMTSDPGAIREAIVRLDKMFRENEKPFTPGVRYPMAFFVSDAGEETAERIKNLEAIERGHWMEFE